MAENPLAMALMAARPRGSTPPSDLAQALAGGNPDALYPVRIPSFSQYAFGRPDTFDPATLPPISIGGDPDKMGVAEPVLPSNPWLRSMAFGKPMEDTPEWVHGLENASNYGSMVGGPMVGAIRAFHGSPHDFDAFDMSKIGTGEGAQAYGHGLYFAENPAVAKEYRNVLSGQPEIKYRGRPLSPQDAKALSDKQLGDYLHNYLLNGSNNIASIDAQLASLDDYLRRTSKDGAGVEPKYGVDRQIFERNKGARAALAQHRDEFSFSPSGKTYEVSIDAHPDEFLDWDKPLSEQSPQVQAAVQKLQAQMPDTSFGSAAPIEQGNTLYQRLAWEHRGEKMLGHGDKQWGPVPYSDEVAATDALRAAGIKGIRYADQGSRIPKNWRIWSPKENGTLKWSVGNDMLGGNIQHFDTEAEARAFYHDNTPAKPTSNFVVFDDRVISILKKYGIAGLSTLGAAGGAAAVGGGDRAQAAER